MGLVVKKFGGTSVGDLSRIHHVANLVHDYKQKTGNDVVVVVSAMAGETNRLIDLAKSCVARPEPRELDVLVSTGEQVSTSLLSMALMAQGSKAKSFSARQAGISTNTSFTKAQIEEIQDERIRESIAAGFIPVVAGFQGINQSGDITTLGRGGSDITAVALAAALKADACYIYTDVDGVYSTDPRVCPEATRLDRICHEEMLEFSSMGAKVLHPRSVYFAMAYHVPLCVLSTFEPGEGTWIVKEEELMEKPIVTGVTYRTDEAKITISKLPSDPKALSTLFSVMAEHGIFIDMITQTGFDGSKTDISFTVMDDDSTNALEIVQQLVPELGAQGAECDRDIAKISIIGVGMRYHSGVASQMFEALASENIGVEMISTSEIKVSVVVPKKYWEVAVRTLNQSFCSHNIEVSVEK
ncbi:MAG: aspartate kinase [Deltaproteobacteria bacterium]|nr:aspartate kinase [Deltaproteobacteria bacterium]